MAEYIITDEEIKGIIENIKNRKTLQVRQILNKLKPYELKDKLKTILKGRSTMINKDELNEILEEDEKTED